MPIENYGLREAVIDATEESITIYLHTGNPGSNGTANRVSSSALPSRTIAAGATGWDIHATQGHAEVAADVDFGAAGAAVNGINWYSMFKGSNFYARRQLAASYNVANGANFTLTGSEIDIEFLSSDS